MTADCYRCTRRFECTSLDQQKAQAAPYDCEDFQKDEKSYWETGWV